MTETDDACRRSGVLLHVTSIPGPDGLGDLGVAARDFITWLQRAGQGLWQTLPLHPPANEAMSPYDAASAFAGDPLLISLDDLTELGLLDRDDVTRSREQHAAYGRDDAMIAGRSGGFDPITHALAWKLPMIHRAAEALQQLPASHELPQQLAAFCEREAEWLLDHVAFTMLREQNPGLPRAQWPVEDRVRTQPVDRELAFAHLESAVQFLFDVQLRALHTYAGAHGVWLMGDAPIYVGEDSADVWGNPELFLLDEAHLPLVRTGAPPDAMDPDGQLWPMPAYDWAANAASGYEWWLRRLQREQRFADVVRIDHFRAFADWWSVPAGEPSSAGRWELGPGAAFFELVRERLGALRIVVEDLGAETEPLQQLRRETGLPQMRVLVQGLDEDPSSPHLPDAWNGPEAAYTDTHDFDTIAGWASRASEERLAFAFELTGTDTIEDLPRAAIELVADSRARYAIAPLQDWLELGSDARMNVPGTAVGNWRWIAPAGAFSETLAEEMAAVATWSLRGGAE